MADLKNWNLFGFRIKKKADETKEIKTFVPPAADDGAVTLSSSAFFGTAAIDVEGVARNEVELITRYREMSMQPELETAIEDIVNEAIVQDKQGKNVKLVLDDLKQPDKIKKAIIDEFNTVERLLNYNNLAADIFRRYYVDGRLFYQVIIDINEPKKGILELRYIDPRKIKKVRQIKKRKDDSGVEVIENVEEFYIFNDRIQNASGGQQPGGVKIAIDSVINVNSGLLDPKRSMVLSYLHKCLDGNQRVRTSNGWKFVKDVVPGDIVYSYDIESEEEIESNVINQWSTGIKDVVELKSNHTSLICTPDHPILVKDTRSGVIEYIDAENIMPKIHQIRLQKKIINDFIFTGWDEVTEILRKESPTEVFDIEVDHPSHNFIVNDMVAHNCIKPLNQLRMIEDASVIYKICLVGDTRIKTNTGWKYIKDITEDDIVYSFYGLDGLKETKVKKQWLTAKKQTYKVTSKFFDITGTDNHPILVLDKDTNVVEYVDIKDIVPNKHSFVYGNPEETQDLIQLPEVRNKAIKLLNHEIFVDSSIKHKETFIEELSNELNIKKSSVRNFLYGSQYLEKEVAEKVLKASNLSEHAKTFEKYENVNEDTVYNIPQHIDEEFARLFGFLLGDGSLSNSGITFAEGVDDKQNKFYADILIKYFGNCSRYPTSNRKYCNYTTNNILAKELFEQIGFRNGSKIKRLPEWVYNTSDDIKTSFILGFADADGHVVHNELTDSWSARLELSNKQLIEDIKEIWTSLGFASSHIYYRKRAPEERIIGEETCARVMPETESWHIRITNKKLPKFDPILEIVEAEIEDVYDVEVESIKHNFIANGIVVHNSRAPQRRVFYIDVGNLPTAKAEQYVRNIMTKYKNKITYNAQTGEIQDSRNHLSILEDFWFPRKCLSLQTKIKLLDGRDETLKNLIKEHQEGKVNWVYSVSPEGEVVPGKISWAGITKKNAEVIKITLDNGCEEIVTPDHKFVLRDGSLCEAQHLTNEMSLMPLYTREKLLSAKYSGSYAQFYNNKSGRWNFTHRMVSNFINGEKQLNEVVHHVDFNRYNNNPENLQLMDKLAHYELHSKFGANSWNNGNREEHCKNLSIAGKAFFETERGKIRKQEISEFNKKDERIHNALKKARKNLKLIREKDKRELSREDYLKKWLHGTETLMEYNNSRKIKIDTFDFSVIENIINDNFHKKITIQEIIEKIQEVYPNFKQKTIRKYLPMHGYKNMHQYLSINFDEYNRGCSFYNHKIVKIEKLDYKIDTGTLTIDENHEHHNFHNFALSSGIFVKNSDGRATEVTTLQSTDNFNDMSMVEYFQKALYRSLNVPITRLDPSQAVSIGRSMEITRDELKFSKFIDKLRKKFTDLFYQALRVQLVLKGICTEEEWQQFKEDIYFDFTVDNNFVELKESELFTERLNLLAIIDPFVNKYFSEEWVQKNILRFDDEDIETIEKQMEKGKVKDFEQQVQDTDNQVKLQARSVQMQTQLGLLPEQPIEAGQEAQGSPGQSAPTTGKNNPYNVNK